MLTAGRSATLALLLSFAFGFADAIRPLKNGPMIDAEGREYKSPSLRTDVENISGPQLNDGSTVRVHCTETSMIIVVKADLYKTGRLVSPAELFLAEADHSQSGRCQAVAAGDAEYVIEAQLQDCGSTLTISEDHVIYSNKLVISPAAGYHGITRTGHAVVPVSCHYKRTHVVSSGAQNPALAISASDHSALDHSALDHSALDHSALDHSASDHSALDHSALDHSAFSLKLMTDDWTRETISSTFYLGDPLHLEASYMGSDSGQRRLFMDNCVATLSPDATSVPRYYFIENHGCLTDAKQGGSNTLFRPRRRTYSLQLQLSAFLFHQDSRNSIFITCQLKATFGMWTSNPVNKACNYIHSRWANVDGFDDVCRCCDGTCDQSSPRTNYKTNLKGLVTEDNVACGTVTLGPLMIFPSDWCRLASDCLDETSELTGLSGSS
uniref:zona pellucida sperm-binding protein 3-like n=1 Tax=Scatophagus argus TaxID=75038 RepID=UPI001ED7DFB3|nr:zona pellucida sperm-binding protein 3-like [Scatophagus argus]